MDRFLHREECYKIRGAIFEVYKTLGGGFLESVYQECLEKELSLRNIPFTTQPEIPIFYKETRLNQTFRADLLCYEKIIIELKAVQSLNQTHRTQILNYLSATGIALGLLVNFGSHPHVAIERYVK